MGGGTKVIEETVLGQFLGADGVNELRTKIIDMIVEEIRRQLGCEYIIAPNDISDAVVSDAIDQIREEVVEEYKEKMSEIVHKKMEKLWD